MLAVNSILVKIPSSFAFNMRATQTVLLTPCPPHDGCIPCGTYRCLSEGATAQPSLTPVVHTCGEGFTGPAGEKELDRQRLNTWEDLRGSGIFVACQRFLGTDVQQWTMHSAPSNLSFPLPIPIPLSRSCHAFTAPLGRMRRRGKLQTAVRPAASTAARANTAAIQKQAI